MHARYGMTRLCRQGASPELPCRRSLPPACISRACRRVELPIRKRREERSDPLQNPRVTPTSRFFHVPPTAGSWTDMFLSPADPSQSLRVVFLSFGHPSKSPTHSQQMHRPKRLRNPRHAALSGRFLFQPACVFQCEMPELFRRDDDLSARAIPGRVDVLWSSPVVTTTNGASRTRQRPEGQVEAPGRPTHTISVGRCLPMHASRLHNNPSALQPSLQP